MTFLMSFESNLIFCRTLKDWHDELLLLVCCYSPKQSHAHINIFAFPPLIRIILLVPFFCFVGDDIFTEGIEARMASLPGEYSAMCSFIVAHNFSNS
jgi:hypothetical protein